MKALAFGAFVWNDVQHLGHGRLRNENNPAGSDPKNLPKSTGGTKLGEIEGGGHCGATLGNGLTP